MAVREYKYVKHSDKQRAMILETAKRLFMENEIKDITMAQIAKECGITRATLYKYFENKDAVVWDIYVSFSEITIGKIQKKISEEALSAYERIAVYLRGLLDIFIEMPEFYKFFSHFSKEYLNNQMYPDTIYTRELFEKTGLTSGSIVAYIIENFDDASIREGIDPKTTGVSIAYGAFGFIQVIYNNQASIPLKYGISPVRVLVNGMKNMLVAVKREGYHSELAEHIWDDIEL